MQKMRNMVYGSFLIMLVVVYQFKNTPKHLVGAVAVAFVLGVLSAVLIADQKESPNG